MSDVAVNGVPVESAGFRYVLNALVAPRPIAWVSTLSSDGVRNLAPHSYFTVVSTEPPMVGFTSTGRKDTLSNIEATGEFVVNVVSVEAFEAMNATSALVGPEVDEFDLAGVEAVLSEEVAAPGVAGAPGRLECRLVSVHEHGNGFFVVGEVVAAHVAPRVLDEGGRVVERLVDPLSRLGGSNYAGLGHVFKAQRPT